MKKLPIGIEDFQKLRKNNFYYVDKTSMITELLNHPAEVTLFTRPRRFGKTLNMSMLRYFFEIGSDSDLFYGLAIEKEQELCERYQGKYPVISLSLKSVSFSRFEDAVYQLKSVIARETRRIDLKLEEALLPAELKEFWDSLKNAKKMDDFDLMDSLKLMSEVLHNYYKKNVIILIDEYDVPLAKAAENHYYDRMIDLIRGLFDVLKTNEYLEFAILTGCLRVSKESIFTGLNNPTVYSVTDLEFDDDFGFTEKEIQELVRYYKIDAYLEIIRKWYDGYLFGNTRIYCPWSVLLYSSRVIRSGQSSPESFWINSSSNDILHRLIHKFGDRIQNELSDLISGRSISQKIDQKITYNELYTSVHHVWSTLFTTGYLTGARDYAHSGFELVIPNEEIREIYVEQILTWSMKNLQADTVALRSLAADFADGNANGVEKVLNQFLQNTISVRDTATRAIKENYYHGLLVGMLGLMEGWYVRSGVESGDGYLDILARKQDLFGIVIEVKYGLHRAGEALAQIEDKAYTSILSDCSKILKYGIAFERKKCRVIVDTEFPAHPDTVI